MKDVELLKAELYDQCRMYITEKMVHIQSAMDNARESANDDSKSSAGDKHETGRSMAQLEQEKLSGQLNEIEKLSTTLNYIQRGKTSSVISLGSLVYTDNGNYFISISAGKLSVNGEIFIAVSSKSPVGMALLESNGSKAFNFNGKIYTIKKVC
ncbi:MAG TPA: 3-oxoacyl-ACP synthase [Bacteroidia bacterium]|jgi:transcription elongation GreA/GreB family factor